MHSVEAAVQLTDDQAACYVAGNKVQQYAPLQLLVEVMRLYIMYRVLVRCNGLFCNGHLACLLH